MEKPIMRVAFLAAEVAPLAKAGGLADVAGSLPKALADLGVDVRVVMPRYQSIDATRFSLQKRSEEFSVRFDGIDHVVRIFETTLPSSSVPIYLLDHPHYEGTGDIYYQDVTNTTEQQAMQIERFLFFSLAARSLPKVLGWQPDLIHCHDWHTGAFPHLLRSAASEDGPITKTVYTIHNLPLQGIVSRQRFAELFAGTPLLQTPREAGMGDINLAALGIQEADLLTTVSPTYAKEILLPEYGGGLDGLLRARSASLTGILNGIDTTAFDPARDPAILPYDVATVNKKRANTDRLCEERHLERGRPLLGMVSRLTSQKGIDLVCDIAPRLVELGANLLVLGSGEAELERRLARLAQRFPQAISVAVGFDAALAQRVYAGSDLFLMPSLFEPCGLGQMIALRYGTIPIVRATGGLRDTVRDGETGFTFSQPTADEFLVTCQRALKAFHEPEAWAALQRRAMEQDFSWTTSAQRYLDLYSSLLTPHASK